MSNFSKKMIVIASVVVAIAIIIDSIIMKQSKNSADSSDIKSYTTESVSRANGKDGNPCYVILSGKVYEIRQGNKWKEGEHIPSEGDAYCGQDATDVITKSPHGKSIISLLTEIGKLE